MTKNSKTDKYISDEWSRVIL